MKDYDINSTAELSMYDKLLLLPLFQGVTQECLENLVEHLPFHFLKFADGEAVVKEGEPCTHIRFVVTGAVEVHIKSKARSCVAIDFSLQAPEVIAPEYLFGRLTAYPYTITAKGQCGILQILKSDFVDMLQQERVILFNMLNYLSRNAQSSTNVIVNSMHGNLQQRLAFIVLTLTPRSANDIVISYKAADLCQILGCRSTTLDAALDAMKQEGLTTHTADTIRVYKRNSLEQLLQY